jgi:integrase/recombinase XerD
MKKLWDVCNEDFESVLNRYERHLRNQRFSSNTVERYKKDISRLLVFSSDRHPTLAQADAYRDSLIEDGVAASSVNTVGCALKQFYSMYGEIYKIKTLRVRNTIPYFFSEDEVGRIFDAASHNIKHLAMLQTMFYGCLRASELCNLEDRDVNLNNQSIRVRHGKGDEEGIVLINSLCVKTLRKYLEVRPPLLIDGKQYLFYTDYNRKWNRVVLFEVFRDIKHRAKVSSPGGLHVFSRHTPSTLMIAHGADIRVVQTILRHNDIKTTLRYAHVSDTTKRTMYDKFLTV